MSAAIKPAPTWHVGQRVWVVGVEGRKDGQREMVVCRVGSVFGYYNATGNNDRSAVRFSLENGVAEFGVRVYASREAYEESMRADYLWRQFRREVEGVFRAPAHLSADDITRLTDAVRGGGR